MSNVQPGSIYWIDHFGVPTNDLLRWKAFFETVMGAHAHVIYGLTTIERQRKAPIRCFMEMGRYHHIGGFLQEFKLAPTAGVGKGLPRYAFFVRADDIDRLRRHLDEHKVPHLDPIRGAAEGEEGTSLRFEDPDGTQLEFWAPKTLPEGAMDLGNPLGIGRLSHVVKESRDLDRTAAFYTKYFAMSVVRNGDIPKDTLVLEAAGPFRLVFKAVTALGPRTGTQLKYEGQHMALAVREDEFLTAYRRLWEGLPESDYVPGQPKPEDGAITPRTEHHGTVIRGESPDLYGRGIYIYDWDANTYHYVGVRPVDGGMANYVVTNDAGVPARPKG
jgi:catechol 2,3-dioxygenase-like lactoylglutathione lyase family enzyme